MTTETHEHQAHGHDHDHHHPIDIYVDNRPYRVETDDITGAGLKVLAGIPSDYQLFKEVPGDEPDPGIRDDQVIELHRGEKFYAVPAGTLG